MNIAKGRGIGIPMPRIFIRSQNLITTGSWEKEEMVAVASLK